MSETQHAYPIDRREAIRRVSALLGGIAFVGGSTLVTACEQAQRGAAAARGGAGTFTARDIALLDEVAETILPETKTPGAKAAQVGPFMALMVTDTYADADQITFRDGMRRLDEACRAMHHTPFLEATPPQRLALLEQLDREQKAYMDARRGDERKMWRLPNARLGRCRRIEPLLTFCGEMPTFSRSVTSSGLMQGERKCKN